MKGEIRIGLSSETVLRMHGWPTREVGPPTLTQRLAMFALSLVASVVFLQTISTVARADAPDSLMIHVRMEAVILSDNDGSNPKGVLSVAQLEQWIDNADKSLSVSHANIVIDFDPTKDLARVRNSTINRLDHNSDPVASAHAASPSTSTLHVANKWAIHAVLMVANMSATALTAEKDLAALRRMASSDHVAT